MVGQHDRFAQQAAAQSPHFETKDPPALQARHDMMRAKLFGFMGDQAEVARRYPVSDNSLPARYARAISGYRFGRLGEALQAIDGLIATQPANPYFQELKGQVLMESGARRPACPICARRLRWRRTPRRSPCCSAMR